MTARVGDWFQTHHGRRFYVEDPLPEDVAIQDIAASLARICRFNGHVMSFYSVAQHCCLVSRIVPERLAFEGLMHDAEEAYTGDVIAPLKRTLRRRTDAFDRIAENITLAVRRKFEMGDTLSEADERIIRDADWTALSTERRDVLLPTGWAWRTSESHPPCKERIEPWPYQRAESEFLERFNWVRGACR